MKQASDASSAVVRAGALQAITILLQAPESHAVLRTLLPLVGNLIHDQAARVRLACVKMLMAVQELAPTIKFYHVVPLHHLTARLAEEKSSAGSQVASALTRLLLPSYLPTTVGGANQVQRTLVFLARDPSAAAIFYAHVAQHVPVSTVTKLIIMLWKCLVAAVEAAEPATTTEEHATTESTEAMDATHTAVDKDESTDTEEVSKDNNESTATAPNMTLTASNLPLLASMAETIGTLWSSIEVALTKPNYRPCYEFLMESFSGSALTDALQYFETQATTFTERRGDEHDNISCCYRVCDELLQCASRLPPDTIPCLIPHLVTRLATVSDKAGLFASDGEVSTKEAGDNIIAILTLLCSWGYTEQVAHCLCSSLLSVLSNGDDDEIASSPSLPLSKKRGRKDARAKQQGSARDVSGSQLSLTTLSAPVAVYILDNILCGSSSFSAAARELLFASTTATETLEQSLQCSLKCAERLMKADVVRKILGVV
jgi:hypothetical protein